LGHASLAVRRCVGGLRRRADLKESNAQSPRALTRFACPALVDTFYPAFDYDSSCNKSTSPVPDPRCFSRTNQHAPRQLPAFSRRSPLPFVSGSPAAHLVLCLSCIWGLRRSSLSAIPRTLSGPQPAPSSAVPPRVPTGPERTDASHPTVLMHPGEHLCEIQRVFEPFASLRRMRSAISVYTVILSRSCTVVT